MHFQHSEHILLSLLVLPLLLPQIHWHSITTVRKNYKPLQATVDGFWTVHPSVLRHYKVICKEIIKNNIFRIPDLLGSNDSLVFRLSEGYCIPTQFYILLYY